MGPETYAWGGWWLFPIMPLLMIACFAAMFYFCMGRRSGHTRRRDNDGPSGHLEGTESALEILKQRYAKGDITREEFEQMKREIES
ncbi:SHOCT domain-containing protein [Halomonas vilamensis]|uniref:SHOCT domain-containing protein n=1 Tax=Vreelandella vilamensis TaxID=531309 RepID=A0ABU1H2H9_9GAMM|nr:SHOCT domain-containing protein [Halomonas vilamensis]MDR5898507.1 SHOCT domain-containing protein [Halomonas vilamensis]